MKHYQHPTTREVFAFATDEERQQLGDQELVEMTELELQEHLAGVAQPEVPQVVTRFQARAALHLAGLLGQVEAHMTDPSTDMLARLAWTDAQEFRRHSPTVLGMASALGLSDQQLDNLFTTAAGIQA